MTSVSQVALVTVVEHQAQNLCHIHVHGFHVTDPNFPGRTVQRNAMALENNVLGGEYQSVLSTDDGAFHFDGGSIWFPNN